MSLVCTPQTGKVLNYKNSVNNQLVHKSSIDTRPVRQQNCPNEEKTVKRKKNAKYVTRETGTCSGTHSVESWPGIDNDDRPWNRVREAGSRWRLNRRRRTGDVSGQTRSTRPMAGDNVGTTTARTAGRGCGKAWSLAATMCQRRPSDQLTPSHRLDGDAGERQHVSPFTDNSSRHAVQQRHTLGRQRVSSPVRQLRLTLGLTVRLTVRQPRWRLLGYSHSPTQLNFWSSILFTLCLGYFSQFINSKRFYAAVSHKLYRVTLYHNISWSLFELLTTQ